MRANARRTGFTLIEVLIVVVIMAVLAATIIPQFASSATDAKNSALKFNLHGLRQQIEMYKLQHNGAMPTIQNSSLPQLTSSTDVNGNIGAQGPTYPFGPYIQGGLLPANSIDGQTTVSATAVFPPTASTSTGGWLYNAASGQIAPNTDGHLTD
jgi:general secretion pathway protein G